MVLVFLSCFNYLIDSYLLYAASVLAANSVLRSLFGVGWVDRVDPAKPRFPLFVTPMYHNLGVNWASTLVAFLALACAPLPLYADLAQEVCANGQRLLRVGAKDPAHVPVCQACGRRRADDAKDGTGKGRPWSVDLCISPVSVSVTI
jgi:hypothetical protein